MFRPLWDWAVDLIMNPQLYPYFEWDAQQIFRHSGETMTCMYHGLRQGTHFGIFKYAILLYQYMFIHRHCCVVISDWNSRACMSLMFYSLCRQDKPVLFWHSKGLSSNGTLSKFTCLYLEWQWYQWWVCCQMAANCVFCGTEHLHVLMFGLGSRNSRGHLETCFYQIQMGGLA